MHSGKNILVSHAKQFYSERKKTRDTTFIVLRL